MTTPARQAETQEASAAFHVALTALGAETALDALAMWQDVPPASAEKVASRWLQKAIELVMFRRRQSWALALAYYRLVRALQTGTTIADPYHPTPETVTLKDLRREFAALVAEQTGHDPGDISGEGDDDPITVEEIPDLKPTLDAIERDAEDIGSETLMAVGPNNLTKKVEQIDTDAPAKEVDAKREEAHSKAGARQAADAARNAMNGARTPLYQIQQRDRRAIAWARVSKTGSPCGFCAMLISRGAVYRSKKSAERTGDGDKFHTNCNCYAEPIFTEAQYDTDARFDLNRDLQKEWRRVTQGYGGDAALAVWREYITDRFKKNTQAPPAQAA